MANIVDFLVTLKDMASGPLEKIGNTGQAAVIKIQTGIAKVQDKLNALGTGVSQVNTRLDQLGKTRQVSLDNSQVKRMGTAIDGLQRKKDKLQNSGGGGGSILSNGLDALGNLGKTLLQSGAGKAGGKTGGSQIVKSLGSLFSGAAMMAAMQIKAHRVLICLVKPPSLQPIHWATCSK